MSKLKLDTSHLSKKTLYAAAVQNEAAYARERQRTELLAVVLDKAIKRLAQSETRSIEEVLESLEADLTADATPEPDPCDCGGDCNEPEEVEGAHV